MKFKRTLGALALAFTIGGLFVASHDTASAATLKIVAPAWKKGAAVKVLWKGAWYDATIIAVKGAKFKIHYDGWSNSWDEWVGKARIKDR
mgnify:CR=1 FL=1